MLALKKHSLALAVVVAVAVVTLMTRNGNAAGTSLSALIQQKEAEVNVLHDVAKEYYYDSLCGSGVCNGDLAACYSSLPSPTCATTYGGCTEDTENRNLDFTKSVVRSATETLSLDARRDACWTLSLNDDFVSANGGSEENLSTATKWQYIGTPNGFYRIFPGVPQEECNTYDPRLRPWYVAATSGPKDLIIMLDKSGSMSTDGRWDTARAAVDTLLETLTIADFVAIVLFDSTAFQVCGGTIACSTLSQATADNVAALRTLLAGFEPSGNTNFEAAFDVSFNILESSTEATSGCSRSLLFLTDGSITVGAEGDAFLAGVEASQTQLLQEVGERATIFTFSLSSSADITIPKALACAHNGTWSPVEYNANLREQMAQYYNYYATLRASSSTTSVVWVEPYVDASGAGLLTTASRAVYDDRYNPPILVGVVALDILASDLELAASNYEDLLTALAQRSNSCPALDLDQCQLNDIRTTLYVAPGFPSSYTDESALLCDPDDNDGCTAVSLTCPDDDIVKSRPYISATTEQDSFFGSARASYQFQACDSCSMSSSSSWQATPAFITVLFACVVALMAVAM